jgi:hypothetical protein
MYLYPSRSNPISTAPSNASELCTHEAQQSILLIETISISGVVDGIYNQQSDGGGGGGGYGGELRMQGFAYTHKRRRKRGTTRGMDG